MQSIRLELNGAETCPPVTKTSCVQQFSHERLRARMSHTQKKTERDVNTGQAERRGEAEERAWTFLGNIFLRRRSGKCASLYMTSPWM